MRQARRKCYRRGAHRPRNRVRWSFARSSGHDASPCPIMIDVAERGSLFGRARAASALPDTGPPSHIAPRRSPDPTLSPFADSPMSSNRREFLRTTAIAGGALGLGLSSVRIRRRARRRRCSCRGPPSSPPRRAQAAPHPHPRRDRLHRAASGALRAGARAQDHPVQSRQDQPGALSRRREAAGRPPDRRLRVAQGKGVGRRHRQSDDDPALGAPGRRGPQGAHQAVRLHLDHFDLREE